MKVGDRIELPVHTDLWMRGARFGTVETVVHSEPPNHSFAMIKVDMRPRKQFKLWGIDWQYAKILETSNN